jgi:predicted dehydrogenase
MQAQATRAPVVRLGVLGTARIVPQAVIASAMSNRHLAVAAIASRNLGSARQFAARYRIARAYGRYMDLVQDPAIDAVYIPLPISEHHEWAMQALKHGKHVLCEKAFTANAQQAHEVCSLAKEKGLLAVEAFHCRYHPIFLSALEMLTEKVIGDVRKVSCVFTGAIASPDDIRMRYATGGGVTMDYGCYPVSWIRHLTGLEPRVERADAIVGPKHVDVSMRAKFSLPGDREADMYVSMARDAPFRACVDIEGTEGRIKLTNPLLPHLGHALQWTIGTATKTKVLSVRTSYEYQMDAFVNAVLHGSELPTASHDVVRQMTVLDNIYTAAGLPIRGLRPALAI